MKDARKRGIKKLAPYIGVMAAFFYAVPLASVIGSQNTGSSTMMYVLFILNPAVTFLINMVYAMRNSFAWYVPLICGLLFVPAIPIFYNQTATVYIFSYIVLGYIGAAAGHSFFKNGTFKV